VYGVALHVLLACVFHFKYQSMFSYIDTSSSNTVESKVRAYWHGEFMDGVIYGTN
jgi:hypothetical protein